MIVTHVLLRLVLNLLPDRQAADQKFATAYTVLASLDMHSNTTRWVQYVRTAAEAGESNGMHTYGQILLQGIGVEKDLVQGLTWLIRAASKVRTKSSTDVGRPCSQPLVATSHTTRVELCARIQLSYLVGLQ